MTYLFSIIIPTYNSENSISKTLEMVLNQNYKKFETLIIDDGSTDNTNTVIRNYTKDKNNFHYVHQSNKGPSVARNKGASIAKGKYLVFLDCDDFVHEQWLETFAGLLNEDVSFVSLGAMQNNKEIKPSKKKINSDFITYNTLAGTFCIRRDIFVLIDGYDTQIRQSENYDLVERAIEFSIKNELKICFDGVHRFHYNKDVLNKSKRKNRLEDRIDSCKYFLSHRELDKDQILHYYHIIAVASFRIGNLEQAKEYLVKCTKYAPFKVKYYILLFLYILFPYGLKYLWKN